MKSIKHRLLSLLLTLVTVLSLLPTAAFAASNTGSGQNYHQPGILEHAPARQRYPIQLPPAACGR